MQNSKVYIICGKPSAQVKSFDKIHQHVFLAQVMYMYNYVQIAVIQNLKFGYQSVSNCS